MGKVGLLLFGIAGLTAACGAPAVTAPRAAEPAARAEEPGAAPRLATKIHAPEQAETAEEARSGAEAAPEPEAAPTACASEGKIKDAKVCFPAASYAKKLCGGIYPEVALNLFGKGTPWTRVYLAGDVEAWNASGGLTHRAKLAFDEEVLVLSKHGAGGSGGIVMTGAQASYDVLRWDGTCVSVMEGELTTRRPPKALPAAVPFHRLEETTRRALLASPKVKASLEGMEKACGRASTAQEKKACDKAERAFSQAVVEFVRGGGTLPTPARRP